MHVLRFIPLLIALLANGLPTPKAPASPTGPATYVPENNKCKDDASGDYFKCKGYDDSFRVEYYIESMRATSETDHNNCIEHCSEMSNCGGFVVTNPLEDAASKVYDCHFRNHVWIPNLTKKSDEIDVRSTWVTYIKKGERFVTPGDDDKIWSDKIKGRCVSGSTSDKEKKYIFREISSKQCKSLCLQDFNDCKGIVYNSKRKKCELHHGSEMISACNLENSDLISYKILEDAEYSES